MIGCFWCSGVARKQWVRGATYTNTLLEYYENESAESSAIKDKQCDQSTEKGNFSADEVQGPWVQALR